MQRLEVANECERLAREHRCAQTAQKMARLKDLDDQRLNDEAISRLSDEGRDENDRKLSFNANDRKLAYLLSKRKKIPDDGYDKFILGAAMAIQDNRESLRDPVGPRSANVGKLKRSVRASRPYGYRAAVIRDVSVWAAQRYCLPVSERYVQKCWVEHRHDFKRDFE